MMRSTLFVGVCIVSGQNPIRKQRLKLIELADKSTLTSSQKVILRVLLFKFYNVNTRQCFPSDTTISAKTGVCSKTVRRARSALVEAGWVEVAITHGGQRRISYRFPKLDALVAATPPTSQTRKPAPQKQEKYWTNCPKMADKISNVHIKEETTPINHKAKAPLGRSFVGVGSIEEQKFNQSLAAHGLPPLAGILEEVEFGGRSGFWVKPTRVAPEGTIDLKLAIDWFRNELNANLSKQNQKACKNG
jgi:hypothetical protein